MEDPAPAIPLEKLVAHREWVRRVARALVRDEALADDLEQEVWLEALQSPPRSGRSLGGWLAAAMRHNLLDLRRSERRRRVREEAVARPEAEKSAADVVAEAETLKKVVAAVLELEEPCRGTLLLRYFEDLPLKEVARRQGIPLETVRTRIRTALELLRDRFDAERGGDRRAWVLLLTPLAHRPIPMGPGAGGGGGGAVSAGSTGAGVGAAGAAGVLLMAMKTKVAVASVLLLAAGLSYYAMRPGGPLDRRETGPGSRNPEIASQEAGRPARSRTTEVLGSSSPVPDSGWRTRIEVAVSDTASRPVAGAAVSLSEPPSSLIEGPATRLHPPSLGKVVAQAVTDAAGTSRLEGVPAGSWVLSVAAAGFPRHFEEFRLIPRESPGPLRIVLVAGCSLRGTVWGRDGKAVPGIPVMAVRPWEGGDLGYNRVSGTTDAEGRYRIEGLASGVHDLLVRLPGGVLRGGGSVRVPDVSVFDIRLAGGASLRGRVLDEATGLPVPGAAVALQVAPNQSQDGWTGGRDATAEAVSRADGGFAFEDLPPGVLGTLAVRAEGYRDYPDPRFDVPCAGVRTVFSEGQEVRWEVRLRRGPSIRGIVTGPDGKPVAGAEVTFSSYFVDRFMNASGRRTTPAFRTGPDGAYRIASARPGAGMLDVRAGGLCLPGVSPDAWSFVAEGAREGNEAIVEVPLAGEVVRDLRLVPAASIEGVCVDSEGHGVSGCRVSLAAAGTDSRAFALAALPGGSQFLYAGQPAGDRGASAWLTSGGTGESISDAAGAFRLEGVRAGAKVLAVATAPRGRKGRSEPLETAAGVPLSGIRIVVAGGSAMAGRLSRADGKPLVSPVLRLVEGMKPGVVYWGLQMELNRQWAPVCPVALDGSFRAEGLEPGAWSLDAEDEGCARVQTTEVSLKEGEAKEGLEVVLGPDQGLAGRVQDEGGNPIAGAEVLVTPAEGTPYLQPVAVRDPEATASVPPQDRVGQFPQFIQGLARGATAVTDTEGRFRANGLSAGKYRLATRAAGFASSVDEAEAGAAEAAIVLRPSLVLAGRVVESTTGSPVAGLHVSAAPLPHPAKGWPYRDATTAADGSFLIENLAPGTYDISMGHGYSDLDMNCLHQTTPPVEAGTRDLLLKVEFGEIIEGRVVDERGAPVTWGAKVSAWPMPNEKGERRGGLYDARVDQDGSFRAMVRPGIPYEVILEAEASPFGTAPILKTSLKDVNPGARGLVLTARRGMTISGRVVYPKDPSITFWMAPDLYVRPTGVEEGFGVDQKSMRMDARGDRVAFAFTTPMLEPGTSYDLMVQYIWGKNRGGVLARGVLAGTKDVVLEITSGETITGTVVDESGNVLAGVPVSARAVKGLQGETVLSREPMSGGFCISGPDGTFTIGGLGKYRFRLRSGGGDTAFAMLDYPDEVPVGTVSVKVVAHGGVAISGTLVGTDGNPAEFLYLRVLGKDGKPALTVQVSKEDGTFTLRGLTPGPVHLGASFRGKEYDLGTINAPAVGLALRLPE